MSARDTRVGPTGVLFVVVTSALVPMLGCEFSDPGAVGGDGTDGTAGAVDGGADTMGADTMGAGADSTGGNVPPPEGFRVFPLYMLQDVPAIVTVEVAAEAEDVVAEDVVAEPCAVDEVLGGYVCDTSVFVAEMATVRVERDGFEPASRLLSITPAAVEPVEVHLVVEGGVSGVWSACGAAAAFDTCDAMCAAQALVCTPAPCASEDATLPVATLETFAGPDCLGPPQAVAVACVDDLTALPRGVLSLRCCCAD